MKPRTGKTFNCLICGKEFYRIQYHISRGHTKFCSVKCRAISTRGTENFANLNKGHRVIYKCEQCDKEKNVRLAIYTRAKHHFCSAKCNGIWKGKNKNGINHWNWKGGISGEQKLLRQTSEYNEWRLLVYKRDFYTCQHCGHKHIELIAHHIKSFAEFEKLRFKVENGITLCRSCHKKIHRNIGIKTRFTHQLTLS